MTQVTYYVASSIDGFIARANGSVDWLSCVEVEGEDYGYDEFFRSVDGLLMGRTTFEQVQSFGDWPYGEKPCWVWTHRPLASPPRSVVASMEPPTSIVAKARASGLKHLWLVGGGKLAGTFEREHLIDQYIISIIPMILGSGVHLLDGYRSRGHLELQGARNFSSGLVQLNYVRGK